MSQSPDSKVSASKAVSYLQGWRALSRLLKQDRSFSGNERHNALLNCGNGQFADISAAAGFDFPEDGRAVALSDWDFDGKADVWISNRTAPRVRLLHNQSQDSNHFIALKLLGNGNSTNADAIGARVAITLKNEPPLIRSLRAGDGFLSQSSGWIQFGLGAADRIENLTVHWPGGDTESIEGLQVDRFYTIEQGKGRGTLWAPPKSTALDHQPLALPASSTKARVFLTYPLPLPELGLPPSDSPRLINLWASWCAPCKTELKEWSQQKRRFQSGLKIHALCIDDLGQGSAPAAAEDLMQSISFPFSWSMASRQQVDALDYTQRALMDRWIDLPVPSSFLVDADGLLQAFYRGPVSTDQVVADLKLIGASPQKRAASAIPFTGRWSNPPQPTDLSRVTMQFLDHDDTRGAISYLKNALRYSDQLGATDTEIGNRHFTLGLLLDEANETADAIPHLQSAMLFLPRDLRSRRRLASIFIREKKPFEARKITEQALILKPNDVELLYQRAELARQMQDLPTAIESYQKVLRHQSNHLLAANNLSWIRSTNPDADLRDGAQALKLALQVCELTNYRHPQLLDTLSVAYAENGRFDEAQKTANQAREIFSRAGKSEPAQKCRLRAEQFGRGQPWRE